MDSLRLTHDSTFGNSANASERPQTLDDAAAKRSEMFRERRYIRELIEKSAFTRAQRAVIKAFVDHWFANRAKGGIVHPGREKLAKKARCSLRTVASVLDILRDKKVIVVVSDFHGHGGKATRYRVDEVTLIQSLSAQKLHAPVNRVQKLHAKQCAKIAHGLNDGVNSKNPGQEIELVNVVPFTGKGV